jgi:polyferredoxin
MTLNLKYIRIGISTFVLIVFSLIFLGNKAFFGILSETILFFQFIPSLINFLENPASILGIGFFIVLIIGLLFSRIYCSFLCPLGILQDVFIFISRKVGISRKHASLPSYSIVRYSILILTTIIAGLGSLVLVNLLDPYSLFGRIAAHIFKSVAIFINNMAVSVFAYLDCYVMYAKKQHSIGPFLLFVTLFFFFTNLVLLSLLRPCILQYHLSGGNIAGPYFSPFHL